MVDVILCAPDGYETMLDRRLHKLIKFLTCGWLLDQVRCLKNFRRCSPMMYSFCRSFLWLFLTQSALKKKSWHKTNVKSAQLAAVNGSAIGLNGLREATVCQICNRQQVFKTSLKSHYFFSVWNANEVKFDFNCNQSDTHVYYNNIHYTI